MICSFCGTPPIGWHDLRSSRYVAFVAVQRAAVAKHLDQNPVEKIFFAVRFGLTESRSARFSPATDVLPFYGLIHLTGPSSSLERSK
ncbi:MAG: hypothetical protein H0V72_29025 [Bradyrhizobium sp.]|nr:hypothetical protein [Bradyrhizobium sp.]